MKRIENKKSEVFLSNWIKSTAPKYADIESFLSWIKGSVGERSSSGELLEYRVVG